MRIVPKMTLAFLTGICAIFAVNAVRRVRREVSLFESYAVRDHRALGRALESSVAAVWLVEGEARALELIDDANRQHGRVRFRWLWLDPQPEGAHVPEAALRAMPPGETLTRVDVDERAAPTRYTYVAMPLEEGRHAALELSEPLADEQAYVHKTITDTLLTTAALVAVCGLLAAVLGVWLVGAPVRALVEKARRIGAGDFSGPLRISRRDELGVLAAEMNATCERLIEAKERVAAEMGGRITALDQLRHADRLTTVGKLASGIAHELGTPLNVISGRAAMISRREVTGEEVLECARIVETASERMTAIIRQLLDFARRRGPQKARADLARIAAQTLTLLRTLSARKGVTLALHERARDVSVEVDAGQIQQALTNLVVNAIQVVEAGSEIEVSVGRARATAPQELGGAELDCAVLAVLDHGSGIEEHDLEHVFEPFFTTKGVGEGTGLGLSVTYGIVRDHGGWITVDSTPAEGTLFTIHLPVASESTA